MFILDNSPPPDFGPGPKQKVLCSLKSRMESKGEESDIHARDLRSRHVHRPVCCSINPTHDFP